MAREIHQDLIGHEFALDHVTFPPTKIPDFEPTEVDTSIQLTEKVRLKRPMMSSPMDTVTESRQAIAFARNGGIGVIHAGMEIEQQLEHIKAVRRWEAGFVYEPAVLSPTAKVEDVLRAEKVLRYSSFPITEDGTLNSKVIGFVTQRDVRDMQEGRARQTPVTEIMTPRDKLKYAKREDTVDKDDIKAANAMLRTLNLDTLPILDINGLLAALVTRSDLIKDEKYPFATKDANKQLHVYAGISPRFETARERIDALTGSGVSGYVIDSRNVMGGFGEIARFAKERDPNADVFVGNIVHINVLKIILEIAGKYIDGFRVGIGTGEVCKTTEDLGVGGAMGSSLMRLDEAYQHFNQNEKYGRHTFIADGGIKAPRHFIAAAMLHKNFGAVMVGTMAGGLDESPAEARQISPGVKVKVVRGMGSLEAIRDRSGAGAERYAGTLLDPNKRVAEGIVKTIPALGPADDFIESYFNGVAMAMHSLGARNITELYEDAALYPAIIAPSKGTL